MRKASFAAMLFLGIVCHAERFAVAETPRQVREGATKYFIEALQILQHNHILTANTSLASMKYAIVTDDEIAFSDNYSQAEVHCEIASELDAVLYGNPPTDDRLKHPNPKIAKLNETLEEYKPFTYDRPARKSRFQLAKKYLSTLPLPPVSTPSKNTPDKDSAVTKIDDVIATLPKELWPPNGGKYPDVIVRAEANDAILKRVKSLKTPLQFRGKVELQLYGPREGKFSGKIEIATQLRLTPNAGGNVGTFDLECSSDVEDLDTETAKRLRSLNDKEIVITGTPSVIRFLGPENVPGAPYEVLFYQFPSEQLVKQVTEAEVITGNSTGREGVDLFDDPLDSQ